MDHVVGALLAVPRRKCSRNEGTRRRRLAQLARALHRNLHLDCVAGDIVGGDQEGLGLPVDQTAERARDVHPGRAAVRRNVNRAVRGVGAAPAHCEGDGRHRVAVRVVPGDRRRAGDGRRGGRRARRLLGVGVTPEIDTSAVGRALAREVALGLARVYRRRADTRLGIVDVAFGVEVARLGKEVAVVRRRKKRVAINH